MPATSPSARPLSAASPAAVNELPEHGGVLQRRPLDGLEAVQARRHQRLQRLGHVEIDDVPGDDVAVSLLHDEAAIEQHPDRLDGVQGDALGAGGDVAHELARQPRHEHLEQLGASRTGPAARARAARQPGRRRATRARQGEHEDRELRRPLEEVVDEVQQPGVGPLQVLEDEHHRPGRRETLEEQPPPENRSARSAATRSSRPSSGRAAARRSVARARRRRALHRARAASRAPSRAAPPRRCPPASGPSRPAPSSPRPRRRTGSGPGGTSRASRARRRACRTPTAAATCPRPPRP